MRHRHRTFKPGSFGLEGRLLLAAGHASNPSPEIVSFVGTTTPASPLPTQVVWQQASEATVILTRTKGVGTLHVQVTSDPSSPAVGVNMSPVDQTVTFARGVTSTSFSFPIVSGAPNPGEADVNLTITPIGRAPNVIVSGPLELRIMETDAPVPPGIPSAKATRQGIVVTFSKSMNPVQASNVNNYTVTVTKTQENVSDWFPPLTPLSGSIHSSSESLRLQSAQYDPASNSVTLVPQGPFNPNFNFSTTITLVGQGLTDLEGNPIDDFPYAPGKFSVSVIPGSW